MLRREAMPACHFRRDRARQKGFRNDLSFDVLAPAATTSRPDPAPRLRSVNYMVDHRCEPICFEWFASCSSARRRQGGDRRPPTLRHARREGMKREKAPIPQLRLKGPCYAVIPVESQAQRLYGSRTKPNMPTVPSVPKCQKLNPWKTTRSIGMMA
jgi:hypothetical protein